MTTPRILKAILGLVTVGLCTLKANAQSPTVDLNLVAPWSTPNFIVEVAETLATFNETTYLDLIPEFIKLEEQSSSLTPYQLYQETLKVVSPLGRDEGNFLKLSLAIHEAAPRIEAYNQFYQEAVTSSLDSYDDSCDTWVQVGDKQYCDFKDFTQAMHANYNSLAELEILPFDHVVYSKNRVAPSAVIYTDRFSSQFGEFYSYLTQAAAFHDLSFIIRYKPRLNATISPLYLSGYGVEMVLKKTDYLVIDDRSSQKTSKDQLKDKVANMGKKLGQALFQSNEKPKIEPLTPSEIFKLDYKAAQFIANSDKPLETFVQLLQDFPKYAKSISQVQVNPQFEEELVDNQGSFLRAGMNAVWLNGKGLEYSQLDPFYLVRAIRSERKLIQAFEDLGLTPKEAIDIISNPALSKADQFDDATLEEVYDVRDDPENSFITWWNDLEKDSRYSGWSSDIKELTKPVFPGQLHPVKQNIFNVLLVEDLSRAESLNRVVNEVQNLIKRLIPVRFGIVSINKENDSPSTMMGQSLNYIVEEYGKGNGMKFLTAVLETLRSEGKRYVTEQDIKTAFEKTVSAAGKPKSRKNKSFQDALVSQSDYSQASRAFLKRMGIVDVSSESGIMFFNGKILEFSEEKPWLQSLMPALSETTRFIQSMIMMGRFEEGLDFYDYVLTQPNVLRQRNSFIVPSNTYPLRLEKFKHVNGLKYVQSEESTPNANLWVVANMNSKTGLRLLSESLAFVETTPSVRLALIHNPNVQVESSDEISIPVVKENNEPTFSDLLASLLYGENDSNIIKLKELVSYALQSDEFESNIDTSNQQRVVPGSPIIDMVAKEQSKKWIELFDSLETDGLDKSFHGVVLNGRVVGPFDDQVDFTLENLRSLYNYERSKRIEPIQQAIFDVRHTFTQGDSLADILSKVTYLIETDKANVPKALLEDSEPVYRNRVYKMLTRDKYTRLVIGDPDNSFLEIGMIIDPLSETAQKWVPMINTLAELDGVSVVIYLNPINGLEELPLKRFYRYVFDSEPHFDSVTGVQTIPTAYFAELPVEPLYTLGVETTNAWHVTVREANMDLDNILLTSLKDETSVSALYELESILIEGHCVDSANKQPPRGLEFEIATIANHAQKDTLVMANLGYFQLKALPGIWNLGLRDGPSATIYSIEDIGTAGKWNYDAAEKQKDYKGPLALTSFEGLTVFPLVRKNPGMESENVLDSTIKKADKETGFWSSLTNKIMGKKESDKDKELVEKPKQAEINIFSVASGKLYERFLSIMIASVMQHTESTVKFWFIENFLSPEFKDFVPHLAKQYNFEYEMVTYKWPAWLRAQTEKQRTIWGYKILFLDVLFPLSLDKVIFVDADQIVRTDLKELVDMDLQGAPYGYTPFCSDRTEMDGFRFWKDGYWKNHLRGRPYHISALYVVDLARFRQLAAGDRLRAQYQQLSADPNSLANLDQDLPNNMIHSVPIFSLPQEWLWCETWCSDESLKTAKTIDLCNNPLTKEPKLDRARRQVPEWEAYDNEIDQLRKKVAAETTIVSNDLGEQHVISSNQEQHVKDEL